MFAAFSISAKQELSDLIAHEQWEPLAHNLLREAWEHRDQSPRGALVTGVAAAEIGFKHFAAQMAPKSAWLIENLPPPPLHKMLKDYLPVLLEDRDEFPNKQIPKQIIAQISTAVEMRNIVVHVSPTASRRHQKLQGWFDENGLETALRVVSDLLWFLDYYRGFPWALDHVRKQTLVEWRA